MIMKGLQVIEDKDITLMYVQYKSQVAKKRQVN